MLRTATMFSIGILATGLMLAPPASAPGASTPYPSLALPWGLTGTWYIRFQIDGTPPGFHLPAVITFHADGTYEAVDGGDFGAIPDLPYDQASQLGNWRWRGGNRYVAEGLILSFSREAGSEGQLVNILGSIIDIELDRRRDAFTATVTQKIWFCPDTFFCPDPLTDPPDVTIPGEDAGFSIEARRLK